MSLPELDPQFFPYLREPPRLTYTNPEDPWFTRYLTSSLEVLLGRNKVEKIYYRLKEKDFNIFSFFEDALKEAERIPQGRPFNVCGESSIRCGRWRCAL